MVKRPAFISRGGQAVLSSFTFCSSSNVLKAKLMATMKMIHFIHNSLYKVVFTNECNVLNEEDTLKDTIKDKNKKRNKMT